MKFKKIKQTSTVDMIFEQIVNAIESDELSGGEKLPTERAMAEMFGVSRPTVRQAISSLAMLGVLDVRQGVGTFVSESPINISYVLKAADLLEVQQKYANALEARILFMPGIARMAAQRAEKVDLEKIKKALEGIKEKAAQNSLFGLSAVEFHLAIVRSAGNPLLEYACLPALTIWFCGDDEWTAFQESLLIDSKQLPSFYQAHSRIYRAIADHDEDEAEESMRDLLREVERMFVPNNGASNKYFKNLK